MADKEYYRRGWIKIREEYSDGFYPAVILLAPEKYCTDPKELISSAGSKEKLNDTQAKEELTAKIRPSAGGTDHEFFESVQVRATLRSCNI